MALNNLGLGFTFRARDLASGTINRLQGQFGGMQRRGMLMQNALQAGFIGMGASAVTAASGVAAVASGFAAASEAGEFRQQLEALGAITGRTGEQLEALGDSAIEAGLATKFSPDEAILGLRNLITAGLDAKKAMDALTPSLQLATAGQISVAEAGAAIAGSLNSYVNSSDTAQDVTDKLLRTMQMTNFQAQDFEAGLAAVTGVAGLFNQTLDDTLAGLGAMRNRNLSASRSATALREAINRLGSDARVQQLVTEQGVDIFDKQTGEIRSVIDIMFDLKDAMADMTEEQSKQIVATAFGRRGIQAFGAITEATFTKTLPDGTKEILKGRDAIQALRGELGEATGTGEEFQKRVVENFKGQVELLGGVTQTFVITIGEAFARILTPVVTLTKTVIEGLIRVIDALPQEATSVIAAMVIFAGVFTTAAGAIGFLSFGIVLLLPVMKALLITMGVISAVVAPVVAGIIAFGLAVAAVAVAAKKNIGGLGDFFEEAFGKIKLAFKAVSAVITGEDIGLEMQEQLEKAGLTDFVDGVRRSVKAVKEFFSGISEGFNAALDTKVVEELKSALMALAGVFGFTAERGVGALGEQGEKFASFGEKVGNVLGFVVNKIIEFVTAAVRFTKGFIQGASDTFESLAPVFEDLGSAVGDFVDALAELLGASSGVNKEGEDTGETFGKTFAKGVALAASALSSTVKVITMVIQIINFMRSVVNAVTAPFVAAAQLIETTFLNIRDTISSSLNFVIAEATGAMRKLPKPVLETLGIDTESLADTERGALRARREAQARMDVREARGRLGEVRSEFTGGVAVTRTERDRERGAQQEVVDSIKKLAETQDRKPLEVALRMDLDGEQILNKLKRVERSEKESTFGALDDAEPEGF